MNEEKNRRVVKPSLDDLPVDCIVEISNFFNLPQQVNTLIRTCKFLYSVFYSNSTFPCENLRFVIRKENEHWFDFANGEGTFPFVRKLVVFLYPKCEKTLSLLKRFNKVVSLNIACSSSFSCGLRRNRQGRLRNFNVRTCQVKEDEETLDNFFRHLKGFCVKYLREILLRKVIPFGKEEHIQVFCSVVEKAQHLERLVFHGRGCHSEHEKVFEKLRSLSRKRFKIRICECRKFVSVDELQKKSIVGIIKDRIYFHCNECSCCSFCKGKFPDNGKLRFIFCRLCKVRFQECLKCVWYSCEKCKESVCVKCLKMKNCIECGEKIPNSCVHICNGCGRECTLCCQTKCSVKCHFVGKKMGFWCKLCSNSCECGRRFCNNKREVCRNKSTCTQCNSEVKCIDSGFKTNQRYIDKIRIFNKWDDSTLKDENVWKRRQSGLVGELVGTAYNFCLCFCPFCETSLCKEYDEDNFKESCFMKHISQCQKAKEM